MLLFALTVVAYLHRVERRLGRLNANLTDFVLENVVPLARRADRISGDLEAMTSSVRADVDELRDQAAAAGTGLARAADRLRTQVAELAGLLAVVRSEAEETFLDAASALRAFGKGLRSVGRSETGALEPVETSRGREPSSHGTGSDGGGEGKSPTSPARDRMDVRGRASP